MKKAAAVPAGEINVPGVSNIIGKRYAVEWVEKSTEFSDEENDYGETLYGKQIIRVLDGMHFDAERDTLIHEHFHAIDHEMHAGLTEKQVRRMATGLYQVMRANPDLVAFIMAPHPDDAVTP